MNLASLSPRQKGLLLLSGGAAALSGAMLVGRASVKTATVTAPVDASVNVLATCGPADLAFGASVLWDPTAKLYVVSDGHECQKLAAGLTLDKTPAGGLVVSDHAATTICNHLASVGCKQGAGCAASAHAASAQVQSCILGAKTFAAAAVCSPNLVCK
jgi:hypothetical protein